jgi:hypothetical protein
MADVSQREHSMIAETPAMGVQHCTVSAGDFSDHGFGLWLSAKQ